MPSELLSELIPVAGASLKKPFLKPSGREVKSKWMRQALAFKKGDSVWVVKEGALEANFGKVATVLNVTNKTASVKLKDGEPMKFRLDYFLN
eukprot:9166701-Heterocapsa_arctica.AAC.1